MRRESFFRNQQISKLLLTRLSVSISYSTFLSTVTFSTFSTLSVIRGLLERRPNFSTGFEASIFGKLLLSVDVLSPKSTLSKSAKGKTSICCGSETSGSKEKFNYSWDLKSDFSKSGNIRNLDFLKIVFQMVQFITGSDCSNSYSYGLKH